MKPCTPAMLSPCSLLHVASISLEGACAHVWALVFAGAAQELGLWNTWLSLTSPTGPQQSKKHFLTGTAAAMAIHQGPVQKGKQKCLFPCFSLEEEWVHSSPAAAWGSGFQSAFIQAPNGILSWDTVWSWHTLNHWEPLRTKKMTWTITKLWDTTRSSGQADWQGWFPTWDHSVKIGRGGCLI